jgi:ABC-2 type transport system permease protein
MNTLAILVRREFWEHRVLWIAPLVVATLYIVLCLLPVSGIYVGGLAMNGGARVESGYEPAAFVGMQMGFSGLLLLLMSTVSFFYLSDCLYAERKDRSILFWKSLPVSDTATVLSKLLVAVIVVPLGVYVLAAVTNLLAYGILSIRFHDNPVFGQFAQWHTGTWLRFNGLLIADVAVLALWYAPVAAYQLLISAWAKSAVFVWTILPPLAVVLGEYAAFRTWHLGRLFFYRLGAGIPGFNMGGAHTMLAPGPERMRALFQSIDMLPMLGQADLWIGVGVAAVLIFAAIRLRRFRDDT